MLTKLEKIMLVS